MQDTITLGPLVDGTMPRHLHAAMTYNTGNGSGTCVQRSVALMLDMRGATLMFGIVRAATPEELEKIPNASPVPFIHAWVEWRGRVYAPTTIVKFGELTGLPQEVYYSANQIRQTWPVDAATFGAIAKRFGLSAAFKHRKDRAAHGDVTTALLKAAGVKWKLSERNTLLPADA